MMKRWKLKTYIVLVLISSLAQVFTARPRCPEFCRSRNGQVVCNQTTGYCPEGCTQGWHGSKCTEICSVDCINQTCIQMNGECSFKPDPTTLNVSSCKGNCPKGAPVDQGNSSASSQNDTSKVSLNQGDENTVFSMNCERGTYEVLKQCEPCPKSCQSYNGQVVCDLKTGNCSEGCKSGMYGSHCSKNCSQICPNQTCIQMSGKCSSKPASSQNDTSKVSLNQGDENTDHGNSHLTKGFVVGIPILVIFIIFICLIIKFRKSVKWICRSQSENKNEEPMYLYNDGSPIINHKRLQGNQNVWDSV